ncbi:rifin, partial [Plasmodium reichenowi]
VNVHNKNPSSAPRHTQPNRSLCECELYAPVNYDNDQEMKSVMENFNKQTQQRFHEYDERMKATRQKCKDQCDKEIQKIILKDKLEKQMVQQLTTLETKIDTNDIPTCICEKSLADKTEKFCLNCGKNMAAIAPWWGLVCGAGYAGWTNYVAGIASKAATDVGIAKAIELMNDIYYLGQVSFFDFVPNITPANFSHKMSLVGIVNKVSNMCPIKDPEGNVLFCFMEQRISSKGAGKFIQMISEKAGAAAEAAGEAANAAELAEAAKYTSTTSSLTTGITASVVAIVVIVLIMVIIYLILRYRRKKKMKKKMQYIKLLEE